jgi:hypothetical protein
MPEKLTMPVSELMSQTTITVELTGMRVFRARLIIGRFLLWLAAKVMGCAVKVEQRDLQAR